MRAKRTLVRNYPMNDATLKQRGDSLVNSMTRDAADFALRNIGATELTALQAMLETFGDTSTDEEEAGQKSVAVETKNELARTLLVELRAIRGIVALCYGHAGAYRRFGFARMDKLDDNALHRLARRVVRIGTELLEVLFTRGLTTAMLTALGTLAQTFDDAIEAVQEESAQRQNATDERIMRGNALWEKMAEYALVGKYLFADTDEARYQHYVLTD